MKWLAGVLALLVALVGAALLVLANPQPFFEHRYRLGRYEVWSDRPISPAMAAVLVDADRRLKRSELHRPGERFRIFLCNEDWRMAIWSQRLNPKIGGVADTWLTQNVYLRRSEIETNRLIPPGAWSYSMADRPLSYYIAHELTHILEARRFGLGRVIDNQTWLWEGYADYIGKGGDFDIAENRRLLAAGDIRLDPARSGLYRRYHLAVAYLIERKGARIADLMANPPREADVLREMAADIGWGARAHPAHLEAPSPQKPLTPAQAGAQAFFLRTGAPSD